jgi:hypothetical protein
MQRNLELIRDILMTEEKTLDGEEFNKKWGDEPQIVTMLCFSLSEAY